MTALTSAEGYSLEQRRFRICNRGVALFACDRLVESGQGKLRAGVAESRGRFPGVLLMTAAALRAFLSPMRIFMARKALAAKPQERPVEVLHLDLGTHV